MIDGIWIDTIIIRNIDYDVYVINGEKKLIPIAEYGDM